jgi:hypothetical protein
LNLLEEIISYLRGNPVGNYRVKLNQNQIDIIKNSGVGADLNK